MFIVNKHTVPKGFSGITLYPFVFTNDARYLKDNRFKNHERTHLAQQRELLIVFFYLWYMADFLFKYLKYKDKYLAYRNIIFEKGAYNNGHNLDYLKHRECLAFIR